MTKRIIINLLILSFLLAPVFSVSAITVPENLRPDCGQLQGPQGGPYVLKKCTFGIFFGFIQDIVNFLIYVLAIPVAILMIIYAGFLYLQAPIADNKKKAIALLWSIVWGFAIMLGAWLVINFILSAFLNEGFNKAPELAP